MNHEKLIKHLKGIQRIVINTCHGGFNLSEAATLRYLELCGKPVWIESSKRSALTEPTYWLVPPDGNRVTDSTPEDWYKMTIAERTAHNQRWSDQTFYPRDVSRDDPYLVQVVEELGTDKASGKYAALKVVDIPANVEWTIEEYDGSEWIAEKHRTWS